MPTAEQMEQDDDAKLEELTDQMGAAGALLKKGIEISKKRDQMFGGDRRRWRVEGRLDAKGLDLSDSQPITVHLPD